MPRDGLQQYAPPPGTNGIPNYTVESARYNAFVADLSSDLNAPRPIVAGGTGAANAHDAMVNLNGEIANQVVTNFDSYPWATGSFYAAPGATASPDGSSWISGTCVVMSGNPDWVNLEALAHNTGITNGVRYTRAKINAIWGPWQQTAGSVADTDARYVNVAGDTMTGNLTIANTSPSIVLNAQTSGQQNALLGYMGAGAAAKGRWLVRLGNGVAEGGGNTGSDFDLSRYADDGTYLGTPLNINRTNGNATFAQSLFAASWGGNLTINGTTITLGATTTIADASNSTYYRNLKHQFQTVGGAANLATLDGSGLLVNGTLTAGVGGLYLSNWASTPNMGVIFFGPAASSYLFGTQSGALQTSGFTSFVTSAITCSTITASGNIQGPTVVATGQVWAQGGVCYLNAVGNAYLQFDAGGNNINIANPAAGVQINLLASGRVQLGKGMSCRAGANGAYQGYMFNVTWNGAANYNCYLDATYVGDIAFVSDYRVKKDVIDLPGMWDTVKGLRPIKYTAAEFSPPSYVEHHAELKRQARKSKVRDTTPAVGPMYEADDIERWGFLAHELQEVLVPSAATAEKDAPDAMQSPNPWTVIAALTKALQEAMTRIEALEGALSQPAIAQGSTVPLARRRA